MTEDYHRRSARVLVTDGEHRLLLLLAAPDSIGPRPFWITPGGGLRPGESVVAAAVREVQEEIGLTVTEDKVGPPVAWSAGRVPAWPETGVFRDDYFHLRVDTHEVDTSAMEEFEAGNHLGHGWWSMADLETTTELIVPFGLAGLLADLIVGRIPAEPVELPWHH